MNRRGRLRIRFRSTLKLRPGPGHLGPNLADPRRRDAAHPGHLAKTVHGLRVIQVEREQDHGLAEQSRWNGDWVRRNY
jgi:hypothetical protein